MTKTSKLRLNTWSLTDDVDLSEINGNFQILDEAMSKVSLGSYVGTGGFDSTQPCQKSFAFTPKLLLIHGNGRLAMLCPSSSVGYSGDTTAASVTVLANGNSVSWYAASADLQMNDSGKSYIYAAIG